MTQSSFDITRIARPNVLALTPYRCARDDFQEGILLDANENTHGPSVGKSSPEEKLLELNRYPDPHQIPLRQRLCDFRNGDGAKGTEGILTPDNVCLSVGSDGAIDLLIRCFVRPGKEKVLVCPPTYPMYLTCCELNDVQVVEEPLDLKTFQIRPSRILSSLENDPDIKIVFITSPGNPTGTLIKSELVTEVLEATEQMAWNGLIVLDEAYIDFSAPGSSKATLVNQYKRLVVLQTFSKSFALAGIRLGATFAAPEVTRLLNTARDPYYINRQAAHVAYRALSPESVALMRAKCAKIVQQREMVCQGLARIPGVGKIVGGRDANFVLVEILDKNGKPNSSVAHKVYWEMATRRKIVVRYRGDDLGCTGCLRITIGTENENAVLLEHLEKMIALLE